MGNVIYTGNTFLQRNPRLLEQYKRLVWMWFAYIQNQSYGGEC